MTATAAPVAGDVLDDGLTPTEGPASPSPADPDDGLGPSVLASFPDVVSLDELVRAKRAGTREEPAVPASPAAAPPGPTPSSSPAAFSLEAWTETVRTLDAAGSLVLGVPVGARLQAPDGQVIDGVEMLAKQSAALAAYWMSHAGGSLYAGAVMGLIAYASLKWQVIAAAKAAALPQSERSGEHAAEEPEAE